MGFTERKGLFSYEYLGLLLWLWLYVNIGIGLCIAYYSLKIKYQRQFNLKIFFFGCDLRCTGETTWR